MTTFDITLTVTAATDDEIELGAAIVKAVLLLPDVKNVEDIQIEKGGQLAVYPKRRRQAGRRL